MGQWLLSDERRRTRDLEGIKDHQTWPCGPILPMKRRPKGHGRMEMGILRATSDGALPEVHLTNMFTPSAPCEKLVYQSFEEMLDDGWTVD